MEQQIYTILYYGFNSDGEVGEIDIDEKYFTNKDKAIDKLSEQGYRHICDDEYELAWYANAEIVLLERGDWVWIT